MGRLRLVVSPQVSDPCVEVIDRDEQDIRPVPILRLQATQTAKVEGDNEKNKEDRSPPSLQG
jgi:hypothetical protein